MTAYRKGLLAESRAGWFLRFKGYRLLEKRYRTPAGEIDLIVRKGKTIVFVEVKRRAEDRDAAEAVHGRNQSRVRRAAELYLQKYPRYNGYEIRFDALLLSAGFWPRHIKGAF